MKHQKHVKRTRLNAWLLTWEGIDGAAADPNKKIIAILDARRSEAFIKDLVDTIYSRSHNSAFGMALMANKRHQRNRLCHVGTYPQHVLYGDMPCVFARRVVDLTVTWDEDKGTEHLQWTEPPIFGNAPVGSGIVEIVAAREMEHRRSTRPLSDDRV